jgi:hypothetical protein
VPHHSNADPYASVWYPAGLTIAGLLVVVLLTDGGCTQLAQTSGSYLAAPAVSACSSAEL